MIDFFHELRKDKCECCGRSIEVWPEWAYKICYDQDVVKYFCSWRCIQQYRREHDTEKHQGKINIYRRNMIISLISQGLTNKQITNQIPCSNQLISFYRKKISAEK